MARNARRKSSLNIYHVMLRGINKQIIFEDPNDYIFFIDVLKKCEPVSGFKLHAYCLMENHVHLLIEACVEPLDVVMKRIESRYAIRFNKKYDRVGHLFQDRFKSEPVENDSSFLNVLNYIHNNPVKAGLTDSPGDYPWSSFNSYMGRPDSLTFTQTAFDIAGSSTFLMFNQNVIYKPSYNNNHSTACLNDEEAKQIIYLVSSCKNVSQFQSLNKHVRNDYIKKIKDHGVSLRQIQRLCGIPKSTANMI